MSLYLIAAVLPSGSAMLCFMLKCLYILRTYPTENKLFEL